MPDRKFHPTQPVTYAQGLTAMLRMLGYVDTDLKGIWPNNYLKKAADLQLTKGLTVKANQPIARRDLAVILDRILNMPVKKMGNAADQSFAESTGLFKEVIVLGDAQQNKTIAADEVLTSAGVLKNPQGFAMQVGERWRVQVQENEIDTIFATYESTQQASVQSVNGTVVTWKRNGTTETITLPQSTVYYLNGAKVTMDALKTQLKREQQVVWNQSSRINAGAYMVINEPSLALSANYTEAIVLDDATTSTRVADKQVLTDKGIYSLGQAKSVTSGLKYGLAVANDQVQSVYSALIQRIQMAQRER
jgi:hypothetical protein